MTQQKTNEYSKTQLAFIDKLKANAFPQIANFFTINTYLNLNDDDEFEHIDTHVAFKIFELGVLVGQLEKFENIILAAKNIWYDNGMVNSEEPEEHHMAKLSPWLNTWYELYPAEMSAIELELSNLSAEELETVCCGEETEQENLASQLVNDFLNLIFDERYDFFDLDNISNPEEIEGQDNA